MACESIAKMLNFIEIAAADQLVGPLGSATARKRRRACQSAAG
jgi:hypothetical protein